MAPTSPVMNWGLLLGISPVADGDDDGDFGAA
jgi:hypothetical protein